VQHLKDPRSVVPESIMPTYSFLANTDLDPTDASAKLQALEDVGVPYSKKDIADAVLDMKAQADPMADAGDMMKRYPKARQRDFDGDPNRLTEMDALVAYLQVLGTMVDVNAAAAQEDLAREKGR
jgi:cytochrome c oxidase cbb3-type subunit 2